MDDHKPPAIWEGSAAPGSTTRAEVPELPSDAASLGRYREAADEGDAIAQIARRRTLAIAWPSTVLRTSMTKAGV
jgi:hypothetical protein